MEGDINFTEERAKWRGSIADPETLSILEDDERYFLHQSMSTPCLDVLDGCRGTKIHTLSGKVLLDFHGNSVHQVGFGNEFIADRIIDQIRSLPFSPRRYTNLPAVGLAKKLALLLPGDLNRSLFAPGGTLAIGMAMKLARVLTGKHKIIAFKDSFHGASLDAISAGGEEEFRKYMEPLLPGTIKITPPSNFIRSDPGSEEKQLQEAQLLEEAINKEGNIGAFLAETIRNSDVNIPSPLYWKKVREICSRHNVILILDEIPTAFGRTGKMFAFQNFEIEPDILCLGKGLGGGFIPFAAMVTRDRFNVAKDISLGHYTHEKSPLGSIAALAIIELIEKEKILQKVLNDGIWMERELNSLKERFRCIYDVRGLGLLWAIELENDKEGMAEVSVKAEKIMYQCMSMGLNFKVSRGNVIQLVPPLTVRQDELTRAISILADAFKKFC